MASGPRVIASDSKFRIVRIEDGERITNVLEKHDGFDALGAERWKEANVGTGEGLAKQLRDWIIAHMLRCGETAAKGSDAENL